MANSDKCCNTNAKTNSCLKFKLQEKRILGEYTDITFVCKENTMLHAHKAVLIIASPYFEKMFAGSFEEAKTGVVKMDFDSKTMETVLDFVYLEDDASIELNDLDQAEALLRAADMFQLTPLFIKCGNVADKLLTVQDYCRVASWNQLFDNEYTVKLLNNYIRKFKDTILDNDMHLEFEFQQYKMMIGIRSWNKNRAEHEKFDVLKIIKWVKVNREEREQYTAELFSKITFPNLTWAFIEENLLEEEIVNTNVEVLRQLLKFGKIYKLE